MDAKYQLALCEVARILTELIVVDADCQREIVVERPLLVENRAGSRWPTR